MILKMKLNYTLGYIPAKVVLPLYYGLFETSLDVYDLNDIGVMQCLILDINNLPICYAAATEFFFLWLHSLVR